MNKIILMGRLTATPELRKTASDLSVTSFSVAVPRVYTKQGEERQTDFIDCVAWRNTAEFICKYFSKGNMIALVGTLQTRMYEDKNGNNRKAVEVLVENTYFTGSKSDGNTSAEPSYSNSNIDDFTSVPADDDLPF